MNKIEIIDGDLNYIETFHQTLHSVASEKIYIEMTEAPPIGKVRELQEQLIRRGGPVCYALDGERVVGWCDIFPKTNPRQSHRGELGMGLLPDYRGKGIGSRLLERAIQKARDFGLVKIELQVYTTNHSAIRLYRAFDFHEEGLIEKFRKLENEYFDCLMMAKFL